MGKPRTCKSILELRGAFRKDRRNKIVPKKKAPRRPPIPQTLSKGGKDEWKRLAPKAYELGTLTDADTRSFELLCEILSTERQAMHIIQSEGLTIDAASGGKKANPAIKVMEAARSQATRLFESFGLTPKSRTNVDTNPPKKTNAFDDDDYEFL